MKTGHTIKCLISGDSFFDYPVNNTLVYLVTSLSNCHSTFSFYVLSLFSYLDTLHFFTFLLYFLSQHSHSTFFSWISLSPFSFLTRLCSNFLTFHYYISSKGFHFTLSLHFSPYFPLYFFYKFLTLFCLSTLRTYILFYFVAPFFLQFRIVFHLSTFISLFCLSTLVPFSLLSLCTFLIPSHITHLLSYSLQFITILSL